MGLVLGGHTAGRKPAYVLGVETSVTRTCGRAFDLKVEGKWGLTPFVACPSKFTSNLSVSTHNQLNMVHIHIHVRAISYILILGAACSQRPFR